MGIGDTVDDILNENSIRETIAALLKVVDTNFASLEALVIIWETTDGGIQNRAYGSITGVVGVMERSKHYFEHKSEEGLE